MLTAEEIRNQFTFKDGFSVGILALQSWGIPENTERYYLKISKLRGTYPNFEREPKHKGFIFDDFKWFVQVTKDGLFQECGDPYLKAEKTV